MVNLVTACHVVSAVVSKLIEMSYTEYLLYNMVLLQVTYMILGVYYIYTYNE